jgi:hypothetical protein
MSNWTYSSRKKTFFFQKPCGSDGTVRDTSKILPAMFVSMTALQRQKESRCNVTGRLSKLNTKATRSLNDTAFEPGGKTPSIAAHRFKQIYDLFFIRR